MFTKLRQFLAPPVFPQDENKTRLAYYLNAVVLLGISTIFVAVVLRVLVLNTSVLDLSNLIILGIMVMQAVVWVMMRRGAVQLAGYVIIAVAWVASTLLAFTGSGLRGSSFLIYFVVILLAGLLVGARGALSVAFLSILSTFALAAWESAGRLMDPADPPLDRATETSVLFLLSAVIIWLIIGSLRRALETSTAHATQLAAANRELIELHDVMENRIEHRTAALEKEAAQMQAVSTVARSIAAMQDLGELLPNIARLVSDQFGFYHAGIFLIDETGAWAILNAASSEGGQRMLARAYQLPLDPHSIVGYAVSRGEPRIAVSVGMDAVHFDNPDLPETRSQMALPLRVSGTVIGALDLQSTEINAFSNEDIGVLSILADQVAMAIENARLYGESQRALAASRATFERYVSQEWSNFARQVRHTGFVFDGKHVTPLEPGRRDQARSLPQTGMLSLEKRPPSDSISIPIRFRGQTIGILDVRSKKGPRDWSREELMLLEAAAERAALALENARLLENAQRRAARERTIGEISARIGNASDFNSILRTTVEEMGRRIGAAEVVFVLDSGASRNGGE